MSGTFTSKLKNNYEEACRENKNQNEVFSCATSKTITKRILDLNSPVVFCDQEKNKDNQEKKNNKNEYKLQAFIIKRALEANRILPIPGKEWILLDAERNFAEEDLSGFGKGKKLDILAYEKETQSFIILELKIIRNLTGSGKRRGAHDELLCYTTTLKKHIEKANEFYSVNAANVRGYIVWPSTKRPKPYDKQWGLIEYDKKKLDNIEALKFEVAKEPSELRDRIAK